MEYFPFYPGNYKPAVISTLTQITGTIYCCGISLEKISGCEISGLNIIYILIFDNIATLPLESQCYTGAIYTPTKSIYVFQPHLPAEVL